MCRISFGNGAATQYTYDALSQRLHTINTISKQAVLLNRQYTYSAAGDVQTIEDGRNHITHTY